MPSPDDEAASASNLGQARCRPPTSRFEALPAELTIKVLQLLPPSSILQCQLVCKRLRTIATLPSLWYSLAEDWQQEHPSPVVRPCDSEEEGVKHLTAALIAAQKLEERWNIYGSEPQGVFRTRAHIDRITGLKIVADKHGERRYLITGAVDGWVRVWDLSKPLPETSDRQPATSEAIIYNEEAADLRHSEGNGIGATGTESTPNTSSTSAELSTLLSSPAASERRRRRKQVLLAEADSGGDVTCIDAELSDDGKKLVVAVGSYYSSAGCVVYVLDLDKRPAFLDQRASLDPREWFGTQCVSLRGDTIAVGTYVGLVHVLNWTTGWRATMDRGSRSSTAALKLLEKSVIAVTRAGSIEVFALLSEEDQQEQRPPDSPTWRTRGGSLLEEGAVLPERVDMDQDGPFTPGKVIARMPAEHSTQPLLNVSFSEELRLRRWQGCEQGQPEDTDATNLVMQVIDNRGLVQYDFASMERPEHHPFPFTWPPAIICKASMTGERISGGALSPCGKRALLMSSLAGGIVPVSCIRTLSRSRSGEPHLLPLRPIPDVGFPLPPSEEGENGQTQSAAASFPPRPLPPPPFRAQHRRDSLASNASVSQSQLGMSPSSSTSSFGVPSRSDVLTELCIDAHAGIICIGTGRGNLWISNYRKTAPRI